MSIKKPTKTESSIKEMMKVENLLDDRIHLANTISTMEDGTGDSQISVTKDILPEGGQDLSSGKHYDKYFRRKSFSYALEFKGSGGIRNK